MKTWAITSKKTGAFWAVAADDPERAIELLNKENPAPKGEELHIEDCFYAERKKTFAREQVLLANGLSYK